jgi:hypothetical protein
LIDKKQQCVFRVSKVPQQAWDRRVSVDALHMEKMREHEQLPLISSVQKVYVQDVNQEVFWRIVDQFGACLTQLFVHRLSSLFGPPFDLQKVFVKCPKLEKFNMFFGRPNYPFSTQGVLMQHFKNLSR